MVRVASLALLRCLDLTSLFRSFLLREHYYALCCSYCSVEVLWHQGACYHSCVRRSHPDQTKRMEKRLTSLPEHVRLQRQRQQLLAYCCVLLFGTRRSFAEESSQTDPASPSEPAAARGESAMPAAQPVYLFS